VAYDVNKHIQALRDALLAERADSLADLQEEADQAAARGDEWGRRFYQDFADQVRAIPIPWEREQAA
jgi:hypothetical protein